MNRKRKHPRLLALFKAVVAYRLTHDSTGRPSSGSDTPESFIFWTAHDPFTWVSDAWPVTIVQTPEFNTFRLYWTTKRLRNLWEKRLPFEAKKAMVKAAIAALRKEDKIVVFKEVEHHTIWKNGRPTDKKKTLTHWKYKWCDNPLTALASLGEVPPT
jgi:hypothetical protein